MLANTKILLDGIRSCRRDALARAITLIESSNQEHQKQATLLLKELTSAKGHNANTLRVGIAGPPGAGKSTFIEQMGLHLVKNSHKVAVIPVDPSSHISGGSILGDKTRMEQLSRSMSAYIRATPTRGVLGGIAEHTSDVINLCESAGFDRVIVESVGLGQSEVEIDQAVDMLLLLVPPGGGDALQATKKGIMEVADLVVVNKADGDLFTSAKHTKADYSGAMQFIRRKNINWEPKVLMMSAHTGFNVDKVEEAILNFHKTMKDNGGLIEKRTNQSKQWTVGQFRRILFETIESNPKYDNHLNDIFDQIDKGIATPRAAARSLMDHINCKIV
jgi:LAO/AO transport system kinase